MSSPLPTLAIEPPVVEAPRRALGAIQELFGRAFRELVRGLPSVDAEVRICVDELRAARAVERANLLDLTRSTNGRLGGLEELVSALRGQARGGVDAAAQADASLDALDRALSVAERLSGQLRRMGMNASLLASSSGADGASLAALTRETIAAAAASEEESTAARAGTAAIRAELDRLTHSYRALDERIGTMGERAAARTERARDASAIGCGAAFALAVERAEQALGLTGRVMVAAQLQDVLRQGLDHVGLVLGEMEREHRGLRGAPGDQARAAAYVAFQAQAGELGARLVDKLAEQLRALIAEVSAPLRELAEIGRLLAEAGTEAGGHALFDAAETLRSALREVERLGAPLETCGDQLARVMEQVGRMRRHLRVIELMPQQLRVIGILMKIEAARCASLSSAADVAEELSAVQVELQAAAHAASEAEEALQDATASARAGLVALRWTCTAGREVNVTLPQELSAFEAMRVSIDRRCERLVGLGARLEGAVAGFQVLLDELEGTLGSSVELHEAFDRLRAQGEAARGQLLARGIAATDAQAGDRLGNLIERFTVFEHKQLGATLADLRLQQGGAGGELTLF